MSTRASAFLPAVLFVDPDGPSAQALADTLAARYAVGVAGSLAAAYQALAVMVPMLIVCELALPDGDGLTLLQRLRAGPDDYLVKPVTPEVFANHAARLLRFRRTLH
jgi:DNA-binding response OmpR family regulator